MIVELIVEFVGIFVFLAILFFSIKIVRPTERGVVERLGKFRHVAGPGVHFLIPFVDEMRRVNITEQMMDVESQEIITEDKLNAQVNLVVYYQVKKDDESVKKSIYNVDNFETQIVSLAKTTARNVIGTLSFKKVNSERNKLNAGLADTLDTESDAWGVHIVRVEMLEITPPSDVQDTMNKVLKAENEKVASKDYASAKEIEADGLKRAAIKKAEGEKRAAILEADGHRQATVLRANGDAKAIQLVNEAAKKYFTGAAQELRKVQMTEEALKNNTKYIVPEKAKLINVISDAGGVLPIVSDGDEDNGEEERPTEEEEEY